MATIRITNAAAMYTIMMLVFIAGMWVILAFGSTFQAQPDLAGEWELSPEGRAGQELLRATIEQSGRFVRMRLGDKQYDLRINSSAGRIEMAGEGATTTFDPSPSPSIYRVIISTPQSERRRYSGHITTRTYPRAPAGNKPQSSDLKPANPDPAPPPVTKAATTKPTNPATHAH